MEYNLDYINVHYSLLKTFLQNANSELLDISYNRNDLKIVLQIVLLGEESLPEEFNKKANRYLASFDITISEIHLTKEQYNESKGEWQPKYYAWLENVLFSKAEVL